MQQITMFEIMYPTYKITKPIRLIELFAGYKSQALALKYLGVDFEHYKCCEWAVKSIQAIKDLHFPNDNEDYSKDKDYEWLLNYLCQKGISMDYNQPMTYQQIKSKGEEWIRNVYNNIIAIHNLVNISQVTGGDLDVKETDKYEYIMTYSFPCSLAGYKVKTKDNYKNIEEINCNDYVLTHSNTYQKVLKTMNRTKKGYYKIKFLGGQLELTEEHPLYVYRDNKLQWVKVKDLKLTDKITFNINNKNIDCKYDKETLWLLGRYVADGHYNKYTHNSVNFSIAFKKEEEFLNNIPIKYLEKFKKFKKLVWDYRIADKELKELCLQFNTGSKNKDIPQWVKDLPKDKLQSFFDGYISGDGHTRKKGNKEEIMFSTVSESLFLSLQDIIIKLYNKVAGKYIRIDNRKSTFNNSYAGNFNPKSNNDFQFIYEDKICTKIYKIDYIDENVNVYNIEVDKDNSYTLNNSIVHNCQDLSLAGKRAGMKDTSTRSGLLWEVERILYECCGYEPPRISNGRSHILDNGITTPRNSVVNKTKLPQILLMENVPQIHSKENIKDFCKWIQALEKLGYKSYWQDLNAKHYGIPQNRNRTFMVSILGDYNYNFPKKIRLEKRLKDLLEKNVDEKYYISDKQIRDIQRWNAYEKPLETIKKGYAIAKDGDGIYINRPQQKRGVVQKGMIQTLKTQCDDIAVVLEEEKNLFTEMNVKMITEDGNIKRYLDSEIVDEFKEGQCATLNYPNGYGHGTRVFDNCPTITASSPQTLVTKEKQTPLRIRKLTSKECGRLMGLKDIDINKIAQNQSNASQYHLFGDSIVTTCLMALFGELLGINYIEKINNFTNWWQND